jgi:hypothetical protein
MERYLMYRWGMWSFVVGPCSSQLRELLLGVHPQDTLCHHVFDME